MSDTSKKQSKKAIGYVVPHTHWDREWRYPLWKNRLLLVEVMDQALEFLEKDPEYKCFVTDGQVIMIEDYLAVRPENTERLKKQVSSGRLAIGPWYTLPDLYPIDGECLVRNLLKGVRTCAKYGGHLKTGYNTFGWGQTAQFPQIYDGFDIDFIIAAKKVSHERAPDCEFLWEAPDGTKVLTTRLGPVARANLYFKAMIQVRFGMFYGSDAYRFDWQNPGVVMHNASADKCHEDYFKLWDEPKYFPQFIEEAFTRAWETLEETLVPDVRLVMDGSDFTNFQPELPAILKDANKVFKDKIEFKHARFEDYVEHFKKVVDWDKLKTVFGELRDGMPCEVSANALASRMYIKTLNKKAENVLIRKTEPMACVLNMMGDEFPSSLLSTAWDYMLQAHPHDSINGVTQDKTADDTVNRLQQVIEISEVLHEKSAGDLLTRIDASAFDKKDILLVFLNTSPYPCREVRKVCVDTPREFQVWEFDLTDEKGNRFGVQTLSREERTCPVNDMTARPWPFYYDRHMVYVDPGEIPAGGYKVLRLDVTKQFAHHWEWWPPMRKSSGNEVSQSPNTMENEFLKATVNDNGTISIVDKKNGREFSDLNYFEDTGDNGDYWAFYEPYENQIHTSRGCKARIWRAENGDLAATIGVEITMMLPTHALRPEAGIRGQSKRSEDVREVVITTYYTLRRGSPRIDVRTVVDNTVEDHRMRAMFPTGIDAKVSHSAGHFTVDERPVEPVRDPDNKFWPDMQTIPMQRFAGLTDGKAGLAVVNDCFTEFEALRDENHTLAITLFRSVKNRICTEGRSTGHFEMQKGSQNLRKMEYTYALYPHSGDWVSGEVFAQAEALNVPASVYQMAPHDRGTMPLEQSLYSVSNKNLVLSGFKKAEDRDSYVVRIYNPSTSGQTGEFKLFASIKEAHVTNLNEVRKETLPLKDKHTVSLDVPKGKIMTIELVVG